MPQVQNIANIIEFRNWVIVSNNDIQFLSQLYSWAVLYGLFTLNGTETVTVTGTRTRKMVDNKSRSLFWSRCSMKASTHFHTTHLFLVPLPVLVTASVNTIPLYRDEEWCTVFMPWTNIVFHKPWHMEYNNCERCKCCTLWQVPVLWFYPKAMCFCLYCTPCYEYLIRFYTMPGLPSMVYNKIHHTPEPITSPHCGKSKIKGVTPP